MSKGDGVGAPAGDSLHLDYPTMNGFVAPFVSFKKRLVHLFSCKNTMFTLRLATGWCLAHRSLL